MIELEYTFEENMRIDKFLSTVMDYSREQLLRIIKDGQVLVNTKTVKASYNLKLGDKIEVLNLPEVVEMNIKPEAIDLDIVYEDEYLLVINKPAGLVVHPAPGHPGGTLVNGLMNYLKNLSDVGGSLRPGIVHRLDKDTSGLMLVAKDNKTHILLQAAIQARNVKRSYVALVNGVVSVDSGEIKAPIGRDPKIRTKQAVVAGGKPSVTHFKVISRASNYTLLDCTLETGRTHQIRVHLAYIGYPVAGDPLYSTKKTVVKRGQLLHAYNLSFTHPITNKKLEFTAKLPTDYTEFLEEEGIEYYDY